MHRFIRNMGRAVWLAAVGLLRLPASAETKSPKPTILLGHRACAESLSWEG